MRVVAATALMVVCGPWSVSAQPDQKKREPSFVALTDAQLREGIAARAGRNYAWVGYNTPEIHLQLPKADNSAYAVITFEEPKLLDKAGRPVGYELQRGLFSLETHSDEIRFMAKDGNFDSPPVEFARAVGKIRILYPVAARTVVVKPAKPALIDGIKVSVEGARVVVQTPPGAKLLETPSMLGLEEALRAYDAAGRLLEEDGQQRMTEGLDAEAGERTTHVFKGKVGQARVDTVDEWAEIDLSYDLPPSAKLPQEQAGTRPAAGADQGPTVVRPTSVKRVPKRP